MRECWIDKRNDSAGNGTEGDPWKTIDDRILRSSTLELNPIINFVAGSGPYYATDCTWSLYPNQLAWYHILGGTATINFNKSEFISEDDLGDLDNYEWHISSEPGLYYATTKVGGAPLSYAVKSCVVDGVWDTFTTSLFEVGTTATPHHLKKWGFGDRDSLGFNTLYVKGVDPINNIVPIISANNKVLFRPMNHASSADYIFNDFVVKGGNTSGFRSSVLASKITINNGTFENTDDIGCDLAGPGEFNFCTFFNSGHSGVQAYNAKAYALNHCHFENVHTISKLTAATGGSLTLKNCTSKNLLAGAIQHDNSGNTFIESNNQFHIDPDSAHGDKAIAFTTGVRQWTTTASTDLPASTSTALTTSVDPQISSTGKLSSTSPCIDKGAWIEGINMEGQLDPWGKKVYSIPNIGADQGAGAPKSGSRQILQLGSNRGFFS